MHVVITGANRGIGRALRDRYTAQGHEVTGTARADDDLVELDVTRPEHHRALARRLDGRASTCWSAMRGSIPTRASRWPTASRPKPGRRP